jgi:hypothetical protein
MAENIYEAEMIYIQNTSGSNYSVEFTGRRCKTVKLNFSNVEGVEFNPQRPLEIKNSYIQMAEGQNKVWNVRLNYPTNFSVTFVMGKITIEVM